MKVVSFLNDIVDTRTGRFLGLIPAWLMLSTILPPSPPPPSPGPASAVLVATPVALDADAPERRRVGELVFLRGWELQGSDRRFGGISGMVLEGRLVTAITDDGNLLRFPLPDRPGEHPLRVVPLPGLGAQKTLRDTEAIQMSADRIWVGFERINQIARYRRDGPPADSAARPAPMRRWRANSGVEAMVRLPDGRFLVFGEAKRRNGLSPVILFHGDPAEADTRWSLLHYRAPAGFRATDAALLPDGRLLVLNRRFAWREGISAILVLADPPRFAPGEIIAGREIAELHAPLAVDNMEAVAVTQERGGRTVVRLASDDNFMRLQRTLLLEFALEAPARN